MKRGRPKGYSPYTEIRYEELADWVGRKTKIPVSKKWLQSLMGEDIEDDNTLDNSNEDQYHSDTSDNLDTIKYTLTEL
jgi:hypothetical protein